MITPFNSNFRSLNIIITTELIVTGFVNLDLKCVSDSIQVYITNCYDILTDSFTITRTDIDTVLSWQYNESSSSSSSSFGGQNILEILENHIDEYLVIQYVIE